MDLLSRLFGRGKTASGGMFDAPLAPAETLGVIGDIHGCDRLLGQLLTLLDGEAVDRFVFVGDYVDRGEESAAVLARLFGLHRADPDRYVFLLGNHEEMMLKFLDAPERHGRRWLRYGGLQTLASFGIGGIKENAETAQLDRARDALQEALGEDRLAWLRGLPTRFVSGNVAVVHAGADPAVSIEDQPKQALIWGHPEFDAQLRADGRWVVHGHTIRDDVRREKGRIGVDTGAYATGRLSAAVIGPDSLRVVTATL